MVALATPVLLVRLGQFLMLLGRTPARSAAAMSVRSLLEIAVAILGFASLGAVWLMRNLEVPGGELFYMALALIAAGAAASAVAERSRLLVGPMLALLVAAGAFPTAGRWTWFGWLQGGSIDAAGAGPIHVLAGAAALACAWLIGPRGGKFNRDGSASPMSGHAMPMTFVGLILMFIGWLPYVVGSTLFYVGTRQTGKLVDIDPNIVVASAMNMALAAAAAVIVGAAASYQRFGRIDPASLERALLAGLVSITAGTATFKPGAAMAVGGFAGLIIPLAATWIETKLRIDDPVSTAAAHGIGGIWALVAAGLFSPTGGLTRASLMGHQLLIAAVCAGLGLGAVAVLGIGDLVAGLRRPEADAFGGGLDMEEHRVRAYPDFQESLPDSRRD